MSISEKQVFISYSWTDDAHEKWVLDLATKLEENGIAVHLDKWDLKEGHDKYAFMESMVTSDKIDRVLLICDSGYKKKADSRSGGVGTETQIITPELYGKSKQEKFIPILAERDEEGKEVFPVFVSSRIYIDLSDENTYEENFEKLLRCICDAPLYKRPMRGKVPAFLFDETSVQFQTSSVVRKMATALERAPKRLKYLWSEFTESFFDSLEQLDIKEVPDAALLDEQVFEKIESSLHLRDDFIKAFNIMLESDCLDSDQIIGFFEEMYRFTEFKGEGSYYDDQFDQYNFLIHELFLYVIAILIKNKSYHLISEIIFADYNLKSRFSGNQKRNFIVFRTYASSLERRKQRLQLNHYSFHAETLVKRIPKALKESFLAADIVLHYISSISIQKDFNDYNWFPITYLYFENSIDIKLLSKFKSKSHFEIAKSIFNVENPDHLKVLIDSYKGERGYQSSFKIIPNIKHYIKPEEVCTLP
ncbi:toll/interleukin-1 receptor domain-containing protein [Paenibacillus sp. LjRoot153]|uniref:toll/interleukin-1 receptor domain-containing protein n=1 Tax=Paenibacillus sp. LjRoot153 TaxID=3342270 RepID=UPI003ECDA60E